MKKLPVGFASPLIVLVIGLLLGITVTLTVFHVFRPKIGDLETTPKNSTAVNVSSTSPLPSPTPDETANWKTYTNTKYGYTIEYPSNYFVGFYDVISGNFNAATGAEHQLDMLPPTKDVFNNFLQIQVVNLKELNKTFIEVVNNNYKESKNHFQTTSISDLVNSKFAGYSDYEYSFTGQALETIGWGGVVTKGTYKVIFFQKDGNIYSIYLKDSDSFNKILSTFKFAD